MLPDIGDEEESSITLSPEVYQGFELTTVSSSDHQDQPSGDFKFQFSRGACNRLWPWPGRLFP